jgi:uncharacterized membrane protein
VIRRSFRSIAGTWLAGLLLLLPVALTAAVLVWAFSVVNRFVGRAASSAGCFGGGLFLSDHPDAAYVFGTLVLIAAVSVLGLVAQLGLKGPLKRLADVTLRHIPLVGSLYSLADRFVGLLDQKQEADIRAMSPVWCFFGGKGAAVLALAPSAQPIEIDGQGYIAVLVPTAPVPFGGALLYVPAAWVRPADIGVDKLTAIYVSMGITPPPAPRSPAIQNR